MTDNQRMTWNDIRQGQIQRKRQMTTPQGCAKLAKPHLNFMRRELFGSNHWKRFIKRNLYINSIVNFAQKATNAILSFSTKTPLLFYFSHLNSFHEYACTFSCFGANEENVCKTKGSRQILLSGFFLLRGYPPQAPTHSLRRNFLPKNL